jgi:hypothetical protein
MDSPSKKCASTMLRISGGKSWTRAATSSAAVESMKIMYPGCWTPLADCHVGCGPILNDGNTHPFERSHEMRFWRFSVQCAGTAYQKPDAAHHSHPARRSDLYRFRHIFVFGGEFRPSGAHLGRSEVSFRLGHIRDRCFDLRCRIEIV